MSRSPIAADYYGGPNRTTRTVPAALDVPRAILTGHRSVVNSALFHPTLPWLYTAGVEKVIVRHGPGERAGPGAVLAGAGAAEDEEGEEDDDRSWHFVPRTPNQHFIHPGMVGPSDPAQDPTLRRGESSAERERRLRKEDREVLQYFDGLVEAEGEAVLWDQGGDDSSDGSSDEDEDDDGAEVEFDEDYLERLREIMAAEGPHGTTRRVLNHLYALDNSDSGDDDDDSGEDDGEEEQGEVREAP